MSPNVPSTYAELGLKDILVNNVPANAPGVTKVVLVAFNRPHKFNALSENMMNELESFYGIISKDPRIRAVVLTGTGKAFCAGADLSVGFQGLLKYKESEEAMNKYRDHGGRIALAIAHCPKPTIVALNGPAAGFGFTITFPATIRVAWQGAKVVLPFSRRGISLESVSAFFLPRLIGMSKAMHIATTGAAYLATDPLVSDLFSKILSTPQETVEYAVGLATDIAENTSEVSTKLNRDMLLYCPPTPEETHLFDSKVFLATVGSADNLEGVRSFMEKRKPNFTETVEEAGIPLMKWLGKEDLKGKL